MSIFSFNFDLLLESIIYVKNGVFDGDGWWLSDVEVIKFIEMNVMVDENNCMCWNLILILDKLGIVVVKLEVLFIIGLLDYVNYLENND